MNLHMLHSFFVDWTMLKRPTNQDTEEDLLKLQEEFLASKSTGSAQVVKAGDKRRQEETRSAVPESSTAGGAEARDVVTLGGDNVF